MLFLAGQTEPSPGPFLLVWGLLVIVTGGTIATKRGSSRMRSIVVNGLERNPRQQDKARAVSLGFMRSVGGVLAVCGLVAVPTALVMMARG
ncbi:hypothetical protein [Streptomyces sanglieri]|uniref:hypothetical protein n=1 Tax=Streptomyces sanglieri TaxID=193460 RepID=UPI003525A58C